MLFLIGTGLTAKDISLKSLEIIKKSKKVYLEIYTSKLPEEIKEIQEVYGVKIEEAFRSLLENTDRIVQEAMNDNITLLVIGTPFFATTHTDLLIRAKEYGVSTKIIHNSSILNVYGCCGLYSYAFGRVISIPYFDKDWKPTSFYLNILKNKENKLHTLCLLDIKVDEEKERFMTPNEAMYQLLECEEIEQKGLFTKETKLFVISRFGFEDESVFYGSVGELIKMDFGLPLHSLIIPGEMDVLENEHVNFLFNKK